MSEEDKNMPKKGSKTKYAKSGTDTTSSKKKSVST